MKRIFGMVFLAWMLFFSLHVVAQEGEKEKGEEERGKKAKEDFKRFEGVMMPQELRLIRFAAYVCKGKGAHKHGEFGDGKCPTVLRDSDGNLRTCGAPLRPAPRKQRCYWRGRVLVIQGEVKDILPEGTRIEVYLKYHSLEEDYVLNRELEVRGVALRGWRKFKLQFDFPKFRKIRLLVGRRERTRKFRLQIPEGKYWVEAKYLKSKQKRFIRRKIQEIQDKIPDFRCSSCNWKSRKTKLKRYIKCPGCKRRLRLVTIYPRFVEKEGKRDLEGKIYQAYRCRRCRKIIRPQEDLTGKPCPSCGAPLVESKKERELYEEAFARCYVPRVNGISDFDPTNPSHVKQLAKAIERATLELQKKYVKILGKVLEINRKLEMAFAVAYKSAFEAEGKIDERSWEDWVFQELWPYLRKTPEGENLLSQIKGDTKFLKGTKLNYEKWRTFLQEKIFQPLLQATNEHREYLASRIAILYRRAHTYLEQLITLVAMRMSSYTQRLCEANEIPFRLRDLPPRPNPEGGDVGGVDWRFLRLYLKKMNRELPKVEREDPETGDKVQVGVIEDKFPLYFRKRVKKED